jgi:hypothetical protein
MTGQISLVTCPVSLRHQPPPMPLPPRPLLDLAEYGLLKTEKPSRRGELPAGAG